MIVLLSGGGSVWVREAVSYDSNAEEDTFTVFGKRRKVLATFVWSQVVGWFYDNEDVTTYGFTSRADNRE